MPPNLETNKLMVGGGCWVGITDELTLWQASRNELHNLLDRPQLAGIPILVLGNKRDLPGALDENGLIEKMNLNAIQVLYLSPSHPYILHSLCI